MLCLTCGKSTENAKFCNRSCSAVHSNRASPKRARKKTHCLTCGVELPYKYKERKRYCPEHNPQSRDWNSITIGAIRENVSYQVHARIRDQARRLYKKAGLPTTCAACGYSRHVEICHRRAIESFPDETPVAVVNALENLVALCPTHHWELDNGFLDFPGRGPTDKATAF